MKKEEKKYIRKVQTSVTCFLYKGDDYLFIKRSPDKRVDPGRLNGIGGRLEQGENFLEAAIREVKEETGYMVDSKSIRLSGVVKLEGGYQEDWIMCFFKIQVASKEVPNGVETEDGKLMWIHKDKVLDLGMELVDDLNYCFRDIVEGKSIFFTNAKINNNQKIFDFNMSKLNI